MFSGDDANARIWLWQQRGWAENLLSGRKNEQTNQLVQRNNQWPFKVSFIWHLRVVGLVPLGRLEMWQRWVTHMQSLLRLSVIDASSMDTNQMGPPIEDQLTLQTMKVMRMWLMMMICRMMKLQKKEIIFHVWSRNCCALQKYKIPPRDIRLFIGGVLLRRRWASLSSTMGGES